MPLHALDGVAPSIGSGAWVAPSADLVGGVVLGDRASVWFGAVVRADNGAIAIGAESNIQDGAVLHSDPGAPLVIGARVTVGHNAVLHGCTIEDEVLVGMGATVLNGAVIGRGSLIGANALVTEGKAFPPGSMILGSPAKAVRTLDAATGDALRASAAIYVAKAARYATALAPVDQASGPE